LNGFIPSAEGLRRKKDISNISFLDDNNGLTGYFIKTEKQHCNSGHSENARVQLFYKKAESQELPIIIVRQARN
jgi:hypothetical protein